MGNRKHRQGGLRIRNVVYIGSIKRVKPDIEKRRTEAVEGRGTSIER